MYAANSYNFYNSAAWQQATWQQQFELFAMANSAAGAGAMMLNGGGVSSVFPPAVPAGSSASGSGSSAAGLDGAAVYPQPQRHSAAAGGWVPPAGFVMNPSVAAAGDVHRHPSTNSITVTPSSSNAPAAFQFYPHHPNPRLS